MLATITGWMKKQRDFLQSSLRRRAFLHLIIHKRKGYQLSIDNRIQLTTLLVLACFVLGMSAARAQFADCSTGLLQMPTAGIAVF